MSTIQLQKKKCMTKHKSQRLIQAIITFKKCVWQERSPTITKLGTSYNTFFFELVYKNCSNRYKTFHCLVFVQNFSTKINSMSNLLFGHYQLTLPLMSLAAQITNTEAVRGVKKHSSSCFAVHTYTILNFSREYKENEWKAAATWEASIPASLYTGPSFPTFFQRRFKLVFTNVYMMLL